MGKNFRRLIASQELLLAPVQLNKEAQGIGNERSQHTEKADSIKRDA
ncbi:MAG: hypothetical protein WBS24_17255 [Terriglobales bacterium]